MQPLSDPAERSAYDGFAMVSSWQQAGYRQAFEIDPARMTILRNAIAPAFAGKFLDGSPILPRKVLRLWPIRARPIAGWTFCSKRFREFEMPSPASVLRFSRV